MMQLWQSLVRAVTGKPELPSGAGIPAGTEQAFQTLRDQRRDADQQTRQLRRDPAEAIRRARALRERAR